MSNPSVGFQCPTFEQVEEKLGKVYNVIMQGLQRMQVDGITTVALGRVFSRLTFEPPQTEAEIGLIISEEAKKMHEDIKMYLLRASVGSSLVN